MNGRVAPGSASSASTISPSGSTVHLERYRQPCQRARAARARATRFVRRLAWIVVLRDGFLEQPAHLEEERMQFDAVEAHAGRSGDGPSAGIESLRIICGGRSTVGDNVR